MSKLTIRVTKDAAAYIISFGTVILVTGGLMIKDHFDRKKFGKKKEEKIGGIDFESVSDEMSIANKELSVDQRVKAKEVLSHYVSKIEEATSIKSLEDALKEFSRIETFYKAGDKNSFLASIESSHQKLKAIEDRKVVEIQKDNDVKRIITAVNEVSSFAGLGNIGNIVKNGLPPIVKDTSGKLKYWDNEWRSFRYV